MDPKIKDAIEEAAREDGQSEALAQRIVAWFDAIASGNEDINDKQSANRHIELLYEEATLPGEYSSADNDISLDEFLSLRESD